MLKKFYDFKDEIESSLITFKNFQKEKSIVQKLLLENSNQLYSKIDNSKKEYYFSKINSIFSHIKLDLIKKNYLDYTPSNLILRDIKPFQKKILDFLDIEKIIDEDFFNSYLDFVLECEDIKFNFYLNKISSNMYFLFHINYDFLRNGIKLNFNTDSYLFYNKVMKENIEIEPSINDKIKDILSNLQDKRNPILNSLLEIQVNHKKFIDEESEIVNQMENYINQINNFKVLLKNINLTVILLDKNNNFIVNLERNIEEIEKVIDINKHKNNIQQYLDQKAELTSNINMISNKIIHKEKEIQNIKQDNNSFNKQINILKYKNYELREVSNQTMNQEKVNETEDFYSDFYKSYQNKIKQENIKIKNEIKLLNQKLSNFQHKIKNIEEKMKIDVNKEKQKVLNKRYQTIIDDYQNKIDIITGEKEKLEETLYQNELSLNIKLEEKIEKTDDTLLSIKKLLNKSKGKNRKLKNEFVSHIKTNNGFILENENQLKKIISEKETEENKLKYLESEYESVFNIYNQYCKKRDNLVKSKKLFLELHKLKNKYFENRNSILLLIKNNLSIYYSSLQVLNIKSETIDTDFEITLEESINNVKNLQNILQIQRKYKNINSYVDNYNLTILTLIDKNRKLFSKIKNKDIMKKNQQKTAFIQNINEINFFTYQLTQNNIFISNIKDMYSDLKKMICILE